MPLSPIRIIQVTYFVRPVTAFAGANLNILCNAIIELSGEIIGGDINDHTVEWEQISGAPVVIEDATTLTPWFINPNLGDEFVFRLWLDRYTPREQFDDVRIFRQPGSANAAGNFLPGTKVVFDYTGNTLAQMGFGVSANVVPRWYLDQNTTPNLSGGRTTEYMLEWTIPNTTIDTSVSGVPTLSNSPYPYYLTRYVYSGAYVEWYDIMTETWVRSALLSASTNYFILPYNDSRMYRLLPVWEHQTPTGGAPRIETFVVIPQTVAQFYKSRASRTTSPFYPAYANSPGVVGDVHNGSNPYNVSITITNPQRISYLVLDPNNVVGNFGMGTIATAQTTTRVSGSSYLVTDESNAVGNFGISTIELNLQITRISGASIG